MDSLKNNKFAPKITQKLLLKMHRQYAKGMSLGDLAKKYTLSKSSVYEAFRRNSLAVRERSKEHYTEEQVREFYEFYKKTGSLMQTEKRFGVRIHVLRSQFAKYSLPSASPRTRRTRVFTPEEVKKIHSYYLNNGYKATGEKFDMSESAVFSIFKHRGLKTSRH